MQDSSSPDFLPSEYPFATMSTDPGTVLLYNAYLSPLWEVVTDREELDMLLLPGRVDTNSSGNCARPTLLSTTACYTTSSCASFTIPDNFAVYGTASSKPSRLLLMPNTARKTTTILPVSFPWSLWSSRAMQRLGRCSLSIVVLVRA